MQMVVAAGLAAAEVIRGAQAVRVPHRQSKDLMGAMAALVWVVASAVAAVEQAPLVVMAPTVQMLLVTVEQEQLLPLLAQVYFMAAAAAVVATATQRKRHTYKLQAALAAVATVLHKMPQVQMAQPIAAAAEVEERQAVLALRAATAEAAL